MARTKCLTESVLHVIVILFFMVSLVSARGTSPKKRCDHQNRACFEDGTVVPNMFVYSQDDLNRHFKQNYPEYSIGTIWSIRKNATGKYIYVREYLTEKGYFIYPGGKVKLVKRPGVFQVLDAKGELKELNYKRDAGNGHMLVDVTGEYFISCNARMKNVELRRVADPDRILAKSNLGADSLYYMGDKVYLIGTDELSFKKNGDTKDLVCQIFTQTATTLNMEDEIRIPRPEAGPTPFYVEDIDPLTKDIVLRDVRDHGDGYYRLFNLDTKLMRTIYLSDVYGHPIFLPEDFLKVK